MDLINLHDMDLGHIEAPLYNIISHIVGYTMTYEYIAPTTYNIFVSPDSKTFFNLNEL